MSTIPTNVILIWIGTNASIPSGWVRETSLDGKFPKGWSDSVAPNNTGGAATHSHTAATHTHSFAAHAHTTTTNHSNHDTGTSGAPGTPANMKNGDHHHTGAPPISTSSISTDSAQYGAVSNDPPNRKVIFIRATRPALMATNMVALWGESDTAPANWSKVTELDGRYLKGAAAGADADLTTDAGSYTNIHPFNHSHTDSHNHVGNTGGNSSASFNVKNNPTGASGVGDHTHPLTLSTVNSSVSSTINLTTTETVEPAYRKLQAIKKGVAGLPVIGIIGLWLGSTATIPGNFSLYTTMKDKHLKIGDPITSPTGGSNTHTHAAQPHSHTAGATHTHTMVSMGNPGMEYGTDGSGTRFWTTGTHTMSSIDNQTTVYNATNTSADSQNNEPEYRTVAFIRMDRPMPSGAALFGML